MADAANTNSGARRLIEETETAKSRLVDQGFSIRNYPDPLVPRGNTTRPYSQGVTWEMEQIWLQMIESSRR